jgi:hypothetical protein
MSVERQKIQRQLAFSAEGRGEAPRAAGEGTETLAAKRPAESPAEAARLMEEVVERQNLKEALKRVQANKGSPGVDGMTVQQLPDYLKEHWPAIREQLLKGAYPPQPVRRKEIDKPEGGVRKLGIPTVRADCTCSQFGFGMGRNSSSLPPAAGAAIRSSQEKTQSRRRYAHSPRTGAWHAQHCARVDRLG